MVVNLLSHTPNSCLNRLEAFRASLPPGDLLPPASADTGCSCLNDAFPRNTVKIGHAVLAAVPLHACGRHRQQASRAPSRLRPASLARRARVRQADRHSFVSTGRITGSRAVVWPGHGEVGGDQPAEDARPGGALTGPDPRTPLERTRVHAVNGPARQVGNLDQIRRSDVDGPETGGSGLTQLLPSWWPCWAPRRMTLC